MSNERDSFECSNVALSTVPAAIKEEPKKYGLILKQKAPPLALGGFKNVFKPDDKKNVQKMAFGNESDGSDDDHVS